MKIRYKHYRIDKKTGTLKPYTRPHRQADGTRVERPFEPAERGGVTECEISIDCYTVVTKAVCSLKDAFNYKIGRDIARGRALKAVAKWREYNAIS